ncbi:penicillin-binding protein activator [Desulfococcaceae bacterium HSG8]|nr:penicillin-binding protein activator [Desulfococcaceae bacterium HSG8]
MLTQRSEQVKIGLKIVALAVLLFLCACAKRMPPPQADRSIPDSVSDSIPDTPPVQADFRGDLFSRAEKMFRLKSYDDALKLYDEYLSRFPDGPSAPAVLMRQGEIYTERGNHRTARSVYKYLIDRYPDSRMVLDAMFERLVTFYNTGQYEELVRQADEVLQKIYSKPHVIRTNVLVGDAYMVSEDLINAVIFYSRAHKDAGYPENEKILERLKQTIEKLSAEEILLLSDRTEDSQTKAALMYQLGNRYMNEGRHEEAVRVLSDFIEMFPRHENVQEAKRLLAEYDQINAYRRHAIGCLLPLSGSYKIYGNKALRGIELARSQSGTSMDIVVKDTGSDLEAARHGVRELARAGVSAIVGPIITAEVAAREAQREGIPIITLTQKDGITDIGDHVFRNFLTPRMQVNAIVSYAIRNLGLRNFAVLYPEEKYGITFRDLFWNEVTAYGGRIVGVESYLPNQTDFGVSIRKLVGRYYKRRSQSDNFEALFIPDSPMKAGLIIPQLAFHDIDNVQLFGTNLWHSRKLVKMAGRFAQGAIFPDVFFAKSHSPDLRDFVRNFKNTFGESPGFIEALAYDSAMMLFQMIDRSDIRYRSTLKNELMQVREFDGITGLTSFDTNGEAHKELYLLRVEGRGFVELETY